jgi:serine/threonine protein kinase
LAAIVELGTALADALADALAAIHAAGFVHRDIAPDNILIPNDPNDPIRLFDFDLVALIGTAGIAGTSLYRPPESESGEPWTEASDLYSLAVVLFELLTRRLPYKMRDGGLDRQLVEPSMEETRRFGNVLTVLLKAASLEPAARYRTATGFLEALQAGAGSV